MCATNDIAFSKKPVTNEGRVEATDTLKELVSHAFSLICPCNDVFYVLVVIFCDMGIICEICYVVPL